MTSDATRAFDEAQRIAAQMRDIHTQEKALATACENTSDPASTAALALEIARLRREWVALSGDYTAAVARFSQAVDDERRTFPAW